MTQRPLIGITVDNGVTASGAPRYEASCAYSRAVIAAGGLPLMLAQEPELAEEYVRLCDGFVLTGGADFRMEAIGRATHPQAKLMAPERQAFEMALRAALDGAPNRPVLGICLGVQLMALHAGGDLHQHLPDRLGDAADIHRDNHRHAVVFTTAGAAVLLGNQTPPAGNAGSLTVVSSHHQAVFDPGGLRVLAHAPDGIIEALDDPARPFYVGVQWHPERGDGSPLNLGLFARLVVAASVASAT